MTTETVSEESAPGPRVTELLEGFRAALPAGRITLADWAGVLRDRVFGGFILVLSLPNVLPLPWGAATVLAIPMVFISVQMMLGRRSLRLPAFLLRYGIDRDVAARLLDRVLPSLRRVERWLRPRMPWLSSPAAERAIGFVCLFLCVVLVLPVPLLGWLPAFALVALSLGLVERDGVLLLAGFGLSLLTLVATVATFAGIAAAGTVILPGLLAGLAR